MELVPFSYFNLYSDEKERSFSIKDKYITIKQFDSKGIGGKFWDCSILVMEYMKSNSAYWRKRQVIEISSGCGLVSMTLSLLKCSLVLATELPEILEANTSINVENNKQSNNCQFDNLKLIPLEWGNIDHINTITTTYPNITDIVICECLYEEAPFDKLLETMCSLCKAYQNLSILFVYKKRYVYQEECLKILSQYFNMSYIPREDYYHEFQDKDQYQMMNLHNKHNTTSNI